MRRRDVARRPGVDETFFALSEATRAVDARGRRATGDDATRGARRAEKRGRSVGARANGRADDGERSVERSSARARERPRARRGADAADAGRRRDASL